MYVDIFPRLWRKDTAVASKRDMFPPIGRRLSNIPSVRPQGYPKQGGSRDEAVPTKTTGAKMVMPPIGTGLPIPILGPGDEPLTTSTSSPAPDPASPTTSPTPAASSTSFLQSPTPSSQEAPGDSGTSKMAGARLSGGAIAGIVIALLSIILVIGVLVYRKRAIQRRGRKRRTWLPRPFIAETMTTTVVVTDALNALEKGVKNNGEVAAGLSSGANEGITLSPFGARTIPRVKPPPVSLLSLPGLLGSVGPDSGLAAERAHVATSRRLSSIPDLADEGRQGEPDGFNPLSLSQTCSAPPGRGGARAHPPRALTTIGVVRCIFEPSMPDELKIRVGEAMRILAEYDDGWGLCENLKGERGVVPLQCLDRGMSQEGGGIESSRSLSGQRTAIGL